MQNQQVQDMASKAQAFATQAQAFGTQAASQVQAAVQNVMGGVKAEKPIKLYSHAGGPNPWKVAIIMNELNLPYTTELMDFSVLHQEPFESINPNGRVPAIEDPNTGMKLWESGAIIEYLLETYDTTHSLSYTSGPEKWEQKCWEHFQTSGQGPYFGQRAWFVLYHPEKDLTSCLDRYGNEIRRVIGVIDSHLKKTKKSFLAGDKCTYADLMFVPWFWLLLIQPHIMGEEFEKEWQESFPEAWAWNQALQQRPAVVKAREERAKAVSGG